MIPGNVARENKITAIYYRSKSKKRKMHTYQGTEDSKFALLQVPLQYQECFLPVLRRKFARLRNPNQKNVT